MFVKGGNIFAKHKFRSWWPIFAKFIVGFIKFCRWTVFESLFVRVPQFHCGSTVCVTHEVSWLCYVIKRFRILYDRLYITSKCYMFTDDRIFTIPCKMGWDVVYRSVYSASMNLCRCFWCTEPFWSCWLLSRRPALTILWILLLCLSLFRLGQGESPPVVSTDIFNSTTSKFVTSVEFDNALSSSTLTSFHGCC